MKTSETPKQQSFTLPGVNHIEPLEAAKTIADQDAFIVDIRENDELEVVQFETSEIIHLPMSNIIDTYTILPKDRPLIIACNNGIRSVKVVNLLNHQGYSNAVNLDGGIAQWYRDALPIIVKAHEDNKHGGCGCSCGEGCC